MTRHTLPNWLACILACLVYTALIVAAIVLHGMVTG